MNQLRDRTYTVIRESPLARLAGWIFHRILIRASRPRD